MQQSISKLRKPWLSGAHQSSKFDSIIATFIFPGYINKDALPELYYHIILAANHQSKDKIYRKQCPEYFPKSHCYDLFKRFNGNFMTKKHLSSKMIHNEEFKKKVFDIFWQYYHVNNLCIKVLFQ